MKKSAAAYIAQAKVALGNPAMSDAELGDWLGGYSQAMIGKAKAGGMSDPLSMKVAEVIGEDPGEVLIVARAEREKDERVKEALVAYVGKILASVPSKAVSALAALAVALGMMFTPAQDAQAVGGAGRFR